MLYLNFYVVSSYLCFGVGLWVGELVDCSFGEGDGLTERVSYNVCLSSFGTTTKYVSHLQQTLIFLQSYKHNYLKVKEPKLINETKIC